VPGGGVIFAPNNGTPARSPGPGLQLAMTRELKLGVVVWTILFVEVFVIVFSPALLMWLRTTFG
jgi:hypothetical protein